MSDETQKAAAKPAAPTKTRALVAARGLNTRFRAGMQFTTDAREVELTAEQLTAIKADKYLTVEIVA